MSISLNNHESRIVALEKNGGNVTYPDAQSVKVGNIIFKYGLYNSWMNNGRSYTINFNTPFPSTCYSVVCQVFLSGNTYGAQTWHMNGVSRTGFSGFSRSTETEYNKKLYWIAIGM